MSSYSHDERVELARQALIDCKLRAVHAASQLRRMFPDLSLKKILALIKEARDREGPLDWTHAGYLLHEVKASLLDALSNQQARRDSYSDLTWIQDESDRMLRETNDWRRLLGKRPVAIEAIAKVETWACGHTDYSSKFALYCAEVALDTGPGIP
jgi:hypothetical protein